MLNRTMEAVLKQQIAEGAPVPNELAVAMMETIDALRAQVEQLQIDLQQANAQIATEAERRDVTQSALDALIDQVKQYTGLKV